MTQNYYDLDMKLDVTVRVPVEPFDPDDDESAQRAGEEASEALASVRNDDVWEEVEFATPEPGTTPTHTLGEDGMLLRWRGNS